MSYEIHKYKIGQMIVFTNGEYSDYGIIALGKVLKDFDLREFIKENRDNRGQLEIGILTMLETKGFVTTLHYGEINIMDPTE